MKAYRNLTAYQQETMPWNPELGSVGMNASDDSLAWLWEKKLALVGADNPAFESLPMDKTIGGVPRSLHQIFIGGECRIGPWIDEELLIEWLGWGQSIVEFLDLETLAEELHQQNRFFLTIQNLNIKSGIASPPNALAVL